MRKLEGRHVSLELPDSSRIDDVMLVSDGRGVVSTLWLYANGEDIFVPRSDVVDMWECLCPQAEAA